MIGMLISACVTCLGMVTAGTSLGGTEVVTTGGFAFGSGGNLALSTGAAEGWLTGLAPAEGRCGPSLGTGGPGGKLPIFRRTAERGGGPA